MRSAVASLRRPSAQQHVAPRIASFCTDFDLTLTTECSTRSIYREVCQQFPHRKSVCDRLTQDFSVFMENLPRSSEFPLWCDKLVDAELEMNKRIDEAKVFEGIESRSLEIEMQLQDGAKHVMEFLATKDIHRKVVSLCWHRPLIQTSVGPGWKVAANKFREEDGVLRGDLDWDMPHGLAKVEEMRSLPRPIVYVGDSISDIPALKFADVGFFLNPNMHAIEAAKALNLDIQTFHKASATKGIFLVSTWKDIASWLGC
eukprot:GEMP01028237.1.p2 GENE.GEMP01028237.1~~GEMP01028237.1.p2  ORF type:complete len:258 (+),score=55.37 GEMP01028237.1:49-822(+)